MTTVTAAIIVRDGRLFAARRAPGVPHAGRWEFPGGKAEAGENPPACLARELREELGLGATVGPFLAAVRHDYGGGEIELLAYRIEELRGRLELRVHDAAAWLAPEAWGSVDFLEADVGLLEELRRLGPALWAGAARIEGDLGRMGAP